MNPNSAFANELNELPYPNNESLLKLHGKKEKSDLIKVMKKLEKLYVPYVAPTIRKISMKMPSQPALEEQKNPFLPTIAVCSTEEEFEIERSRLWSSIVKKQVPKAAKLLASQYQVKLANAKKIASICQRESRRLVQKSIKSQKDSINRAKRLSREALTFWRKNEKEERDLRKRAEKEAIEKRKQEEEVREARRQARKLNFLITQTELYTHFMSKKIVPEKSPLDEGLSAGIDFDAVDEEILEMQARKSAMAAVATQQSKTAHFDAESGKLRDEATKASMQLDTLDFMNPSSLQKDKEITQPRMLKCQLKTYQLKGLSWLSSLYEQGINGILADEMGLGKTVQSISLLAHLAERHGIWGPFLVISPASTLHNWQQEFAKFTPDLKVLPYWGSVNDRKVLRKFWNPKKLYAKSSPFHVLITSYQLIVSDEKHFQRIKWQYMVLDEAQAIKSSSSARWKTLLGFNCRNRVLLTGTPIQNSMQELWALLHFIMPSLFDSHDEFSEWFSKDIESHAENKGTLNEHQLSRLHMILKPFMLRRVKKDVENELSDKVEIEIICDMSTRQRRMYTGIKEKIPVADLLEKTSSQEMDTLMNIVMQLRKVCNHPELFEREDVVSPFFFGHEGVVSKDLGYNREYRNPIQFIIPRLLCRELLWNSDVGFNIYSPFNTHYSSSFDIIRLCKMAGIDRVAKGTLFDLLHFILQTNHVLLDYKRENEIYMPWNPPNEFQLSNDSMNLIINQCHALSKFLAMYIPACNAPVIDLLCRDLRMNEKYQAALYDRAQKRLIVELEPKLFSDVDNENQNIVNGLLQKRHSIPMEHKNNLIVPNPKNLIYDAGKMAYLEVLLEKLKAEDHRVLIYFQMTKMIDLMEEYLTFKNYKYLRLDGSSKICDRRDMVSDWQSNGEIFVFLLSTRAGGLGINLTAADTVIFYDSDWNPTVDQQAMDRAHRLGQTKQVTVYRLITKNTIEERIMQRAREKHEIQKVVISGGEFKQTEFKPKEIVSLLLEEDSITQETLKNEKPTKEAKRKNGADSSEQVKKMKSK